jgi:DNA-binding transcriptional LysR family regulator
MNLEHLRYFLVLSRLEHYGSAAEELSISQPGLSHAISALEQELGVPLFRKKGRNITLNQYGRMLQSDAEKIISLVDKCTDSFSNILTGGGAFHLAGITRLASHLLPNLVRNYQQEHQANTNFHFYTGNTPDILQGVRDGRYDMGFCFRSDWKQDIEALPYSKQQMSVIVKPDHPLAAHASVSLYDTLPYPQIIFSKQSALRSSMDEFFDQIHRYPKVAYEVEQDQLIAEMVSCDFGIAVMPKFPNIERHGLLAIPITEPHWENNFYMIRRKEDFHSPLEIDFWEYCKSSDPSDFLL